MSLDIVIPAHDEQDRIGRTLDAYRSADFGDDARIHVALDGCRDGTVDIVRRHAADDGRIRLHEFPKLGKGGVLMETFRRCDGDFIAFVDADCATPPVELARLTDAAASSDGAIASRRLPASYTPGRRGPGRALSSTGFAWAIRRVFRLPYADTQCGAKVMRRHVAERVVPLLSSRDLLFDVDLLVLAHRCGFDLVEVPTVWIDQAGSKLRLRRDVRRMVAGMFRLWVHHRAMPVDDVALEGTPSETAPTSHAPTIVDFSRAA